MSVLIAIPILCPIIAGATLFPATARRSEGNNRKYIAAVAALSAGLALALLTAPGFELRALHITDVINFYIRIDDLSRFFIFVATLLWGLIVAYSLGAIAPGGRDRRFFACLFLTYGAIIGACLAGNFFTLYLFYELITLFTYPLVVHNGTPEANRAGTKYLIYSFFGAGLVFLCFAVTAHFAVLSDFTAGGVFSAAVLAGNRPLLLGIFLLGFIGFGTKAYLWPLYDWVPTAYPQAPSPAAALLSGVVSKVAVIAILRLTFFTFGADFLRGEWVQTLIICLTLITIFSGSMLAYKEKLLKRRLSYSSVSQLSYILFGVALLNPIALLGALLHVLFHGIIKVTLFLSAGTIEQQTGKRYVQDMRGVGKSAPITLWCFAIAAVALVGVPPTAGFVSKVRLGLGGIASDFPSLGLFGVGVLIVSSLLAAGYLVPIFASAFFPGSKFDYESVSPKDPGRLIVVTLIILAALSLLLGIFPGAVINFVSEIIALIL